MPVNAQGEEEVKASVTMSSLCASHTAASYHTYGSIRVHLLSSIIFTFSVRNFVLSFCP